MQWKGKQAKSPTSESSYIAYDNPEIAHVVSIEAAYGSAEVLWISSVPCYGDESEEFTVETPAHTKLEQMLAENHSGLDALARCIASSGTQPMDSFLRSLAGALLTSDSPAALSSAAVSSVSGPYINRPLQGLWAPTESLLKTFSMTAVLK